MESGLTRRASHLTYIANTALSDVAASTRDSFPQIRETIHKVAPHVEQVVLLRPRAAVGINISARSALWADTTIKLFSTRMSAKNVALAGSLTMAARMEIMMIKTKTASYAH
jgi:hypothetical protein